MSFDLKRSTLLNENALDYIGDSIYALSIKSYTESTINSEKQILVCCQGKGNISVDDEIYKMSEGHCCVIPALSQWTVTNEGHCDFKLYRIDLA